MQPLPKKPRKAREVKVKAVSTNWKQRYKDTYYKWQLNKQGEKYIELYGYVTIQYPNVNTHKGFEKAFEDYIKWEGGAAISTPTTGTPRIEKQLVNGTLASVQVGYMSAKGGKGKQDIDTTLCGVNFKAELKVKTDTQKEAQIKYQKRIEAAGGIYIVFRTMNEVYDVVDKIKSGVSLKGELF